MDIQTEPLTEEARWAQLQAIIDDDLPHLGQLFVPDMAFYNQLNETELQVSAKRLFHWLGFKPHRLHISFDAQDQTKAKTIYLDRQHLHFPYIAGSELTKEVIRYFFEAKKISAGAELIEYTTLKLGLGLVMLNGAKPPKDHAYLHHLLGGHFHLAEHAALSTYTPLEYATGLEEYLREYRISPTVWADYASPFTKSLMPSLTQFQTTPQLPELEKQHHNTSRSRHIKVVLAAAAVSIAALTALFVWSQRPRPIDPVVADKYDTIQLLQRSYQLCKNKAQQQITELGRDDLFSERQIDATLARCQSLRNQYNYQVDTYNKYIR